MKHMEINPRTQEQLNNIINKKTWQSPALETLHLKDTALGGAAVADADGQSPTS